jgi:hypothetical protein
MKLNDVKWPARPSPWPSPEGRGGLRVCPKTVGCGRVLRSPTKNRLGRWVIATLDATLRPALGGRRSEAVRTWCIKHPKDGFLSPSYCGPTRVLPRSYSHSTGVLCDSCPWKSREYAGKWPENRTIRKCKSREEKNYGIRTNKPSHPRPVSRKARGPARQEARSQMSAELATKRRKERKRQEMKCRLRFEVSCDSRVSPNLRRKGFARMVL